ncbi:hypothetical protein AB0L71_16625 [Streptomyces sp. NPDC052052]|uniref:hypothetical protein n=1 Tax=Streptomyces sp. NPDC052052 TaxID=3154756 RepID=UPI0034395CED
MATHAAMPFRRQAGAGAHRRARHSAASWAIPVTLGAAYGLYASFILRNHGASGGRQFWYGLITAVVLAVLCFALGRIQHRLLPLVRGVAYGALTSAAIGLLVGLTGSSVLRSSALGLSVGLGMFIASFYLFYTHEQVRGQTQARGQIQTRRQAQTQMQMREEAQMREQAQTRTRGQVQTRGRMRGQT